LQVTGATVFLRALALQDVRTHNHTHLQAMASQALYDGSGRDDNGGHSHRSEDSNESDDSSGEVDQRESGGATLVVRETKSVGRLKRAVLVVLIGSAIGVALTTYLHLSILEEDRFQRQFHDEAHKILESVGKSLDKTLGLMDSIAVAYVSHARANNDTWPFVTLPDYALQITKVLPLSDAFVLSMVPIVTPKQRADWEAYSVAHDGWVNENMAIQESWGKYNGPVTYNGLSNPTVHGDYEDIPQNIR
jgi:hypothetical protein